MAIKFGTTALTDIKYNGTSLTKVVKDGTIVFEKGTATETFSATTYPPATTTSIGYTELVCEFAHKVSNITNVELSGMTYSKNTAFIPTKNVVAITRATVNPSSGSTTETVTAQLTNNKLTFKATAGGNTGYKSSWSLVVTYDYID